MVDTAVVATDIDTKDIRVEADNEGSYDKSFVFNHEIQVWMRESDFAKTLNEIGEVRARYGGVVIKRCKDEYGEEKGNMRIEVVEWKNLITDPSCIEKGTIIEKHYLSPVELKKKEEIWSNVDDAIKLYSKKGYTKTNEKIEIWEVEGEFPESYLDEDGEANENDEYCRQHHFYAVKGGKTCHLYWEKQYESQYKYLPWKKVSGRALGRGVVEEGEESQVWTNDSIQKEQAAMELSGKVLLKTTSKKIGNNVMTDMDNGSIVSLGQGEELEVLNLLNGALPQFQNMVDKWWSQYERATSSYDAVRGETPPSGQPYRLQALVTQQGTSHFDYRREEWGIFLKEVFYDWVFPYIQKKLTRSHILASDFSPEEIMKIDESYALYNANKEFMNAMFDGRMFTRDDYQQAQDQFKNMISKTNKRRFLEVPDGYYKDMKAKLSINVTGEQKNKMAIMESLNSLLQQMLPLAQAGVVTTQDVQMVLNKIMELSGAGVSPISLSKGGNQTQNVAQGNAPQGSPPQGVPSPVQGQGQPLLA